MSSPVESNEYQLMKGCSFQQRVDACRFSSCLAVEERWMLTNVSVSESTMDQVTAINVSMFGSSAESEMV